MIIDGHTHVASTAFLPVDFMAGITNNMMEKMSAYGVKASKSRLLDLLLKQNQDHQADELVSLMDASGIEKSVLLVPDFTYVMKSELDIAEMLARHVTIQERHPDRFFVFAGIDPRWGKDGLDLFEKCLNEYKFDGLKLYPPCGYSPSDEILFPFYEICKEKNVPVLLHTGPTTPTLSFTEADPYLIDKAAHVFPTVNFILAHAGATNVHKAVQLCAYRSNVYCDISGFHSLGKRNYWAKHLESLFGMDINHKIIFGTDWPVFRGREDHVEALKFFVSEAGPMANIQPRDKKLLMSGNIMRLLAKKNNVLESAGISNK